MPTSANIICLVSATPLLLKFHIYMVAILANLSTWFDHLDSNKPFSLKQVIVTSY